MARLVGSEGVSTAVLQADLFRWQAPEALLARAELLRRKLGGLALRRPGKDFREAFVASRFARWRNASFVRLLEPHKLLPTPDFAIRLGASEFWFETTEADCPGRKRGDEVEAPEGTISQIPDDHWVEPSEYQALVRERVLVKASKEYSKCDGLIIWSNAFPIADEEGLTPDWWRAAVTPAEDKFDEIWVGIREELVEKFHRIF